MRAAFLGIGNELNGDDAAGVLTVRAVRRCLISRGLIEETPGFFPSQPGNQTAILLLEAGLAPENFTGLLRRFQPDEVWLIDAADLHQPAGAVELVDWRLSEALSASTHTLPPALLAQFLASEISCQITLVGIQPGHLEFGRPVSAQILAAVDQLASKITGQYVTSPL